VSRIPTFSDVKEGVQENVIWKSIFRPGSIYRKGYRDTSRDRALAAMNNVLYHLHPVKVKRHGLKLTYTYCLGGLSFFLFILLTVTGIFLMFFYRPMADVGGAQAYTDMQGIRTTVFFGDFVRNLHRWGAHLMVFSVTLHMARVFYTGAYKPPREFNWVVGVILLFLTLGLSFTGYLLPWDQLATKHDLDVRFELFEHKLVGEFRRQIIEQNRLLFFSMIGAIFTTASLAFAAARF
jgi:hypothetical protein